MKNFNVEVFIKDLDKLFNDMQDKAIAGSENVATASWVIKQQQAEIEALKVAKIRAYNNGVEDGRKPDTNNKPVAWMNKTATSWVSTFIYPETEPDEWIPLYTHPVKEQDESFDRTASHMAGEYVAYQKELTDEEIIKVYEDMLGVASAKGSAIDFARAILIKAQEK